MVNWQEIHLNFTEELAQNWQKEGFDFEQSKKWINLGFNPNDYELVSFIKNKLGYNADNISSTFNNINIETFREIYQKSLENEQQEQLEDFQMQEAINQSLLSLDFSVQETNEEKELQKAMALSRGEGNEIDMGWLTDDNITYILENNKIVEKAIDRNVQIKTDIANIYFQIEEAKQGRKIMNDFWNTLDINKKHIMLPLRVSSNHWSLLIIVQNELSGKPWYLNYISSLSYQTAQQEVKEIESFLKQMQEKFGGKGVFLFDENDKFKIINKDNPQQPNTWDCGVYLCKFVEFLSQNELYMLDEENPLITPQEVKEFRKKWKNEIGGEKWCKWDTNNNQKSELSELDEDAQLAEALRLSLTTTNEEQQLQEVLLFSSQQQVNSQPSKKKETENLQQELAIERSKNELLSSQLEASQKEKIPAEIQIRNAQLETENRTLREQLFQSKISAKQKKLERLMNSFKEELEEDDYEDLVNFLEAHEEFIKTGNEYAKKQIEKIKKRLLKNEEIEEEDLTRLSQTQTELINLKKELEGKIETAIEIPPKIV